MLLVLHTVTLRMILAGGFCPGLGGLVPSALSRTNAWHGAAGSAHRREPLPWATLACAQTSPIKAWSRICKRMRDQDITLKGVTL
jgi:hypothetical protein